MASIPELQAQLAAQAESLAVANGHILSLGTSVSGLAADIQALVDQLGNAGVPQEVLDQATAVAGTAAALAANLATVAQAAADLDAQR